MKPPLDIAPELLRALLDNPHESLVLVDREGIVRYLSANNQEFYGVSQEEAVGRHILELNPRSQLPRVLASGRAEIGRVFRMKGKERIVARVPLRDRRGNIVGAMGKLMFWHIERVRELLRQAEVLESRLDYYQRELKSLYSDRYHLQRLVGESAPMRRAKEMARQAADSELAVLITGETGTGKEVLAHVVHQLSRRREGPFVKVNCAAIPQDLFESELFGYEPGAFTGAARRGKPGKFELADGGTIFLDEVGELPLALQAKLLRVIQEQEVERLGGTGSVRLDFRVIAATNRDLKAMMGRGAFRSDLYYRLNIFHLHAPPLREIPGDIPRIAYHILSRLGSRGRPAPERITPRAMARLRAHSWPGNVRELRNALERAAAVAGSEPLDLEHLPPDLWEPPPGAPAGDEDDLDLRRVLQRAEREAIARALRRAGGNRSQAARLLGIHRTGLYQRMKRLSLDRDRETV